jgi:hypothetical protein
MRLILWGSLWLLVHTSFGQDLRHYRNDNFALQVKQVDETTTH